MAGQGTRLTRLDGLRGVAALGVAIYHAAGWPRLAVALPGPFGWLFIWGWTLVDLFFVLSGYVFAHVYAAPGRLQGSHAAGDFWVARLARLWPLHLVTLALFAIFAWGGDNNLHTLAWHLAMAQGFNPQATLAFNSVSWSVSIEMACYALFFLGARMGDRVLLAITALAVAGCAAWLLAMGHQDGPWTGAFLPRAGLGFFLGQMLWRGRAGLARVPVAALLALAALGLWLEQSPAVSPVLPLTVLTWCPAVLMALRWPLLERPLAHWLGQRSFGLYMVHMPVIQAIDTLWPPRALGWPGFVAGQVAVALGTLIAADLAWRWVEAPGRRAIRALWRHHQAPEMAPRLPA